MTLLSVTTLCDDLNQFLHDDVKSDYFDGGYILGTDAIRVWKED